MPEMKWLDGYSGQTVDELIALAADHRIDSLVLAFEQALDRKCARWGDRSLNDDERLILAVEALEREVNNGGYSQFFTNSSSEFKPIVVQSLIRIGCPKTAEITQSAIDALHSHDVSTEDGAIEAAEHLEDFDQMYYGTAENLATRLFEFIAAHKSSIHLDRGQ